jgi:hypothetical protein
MDKLLQPILRRNGFHSQMAEALSETHNMALTELLSGFNPCLVGSYPVGLALDGSDLDYVCEAYDLPAFEDVVRDAFGHMDNFYLEHKNMQGGIACVALFESPNGYPVELVGQPIKTAQNYGYVRMDVTSRLLGLVGKDVVQDIQKLKKGGVSTDEALATLFGIDGDMKVHYIKMHTLDDEALKVYVRSDRLALGGLV